MKKTLLFFAAAALVGHAALTATAADPEGAKLRTEGARVQKMDSDYRKNVTGVIELFNDVGVSGIVERVDHKTGQLKLKTDTVGTVDIQVDPGTIKDVRRGDSVLVYMGYMKDGRGVSTRTCSLLPIKTATC